MSGTAAAAARRVAVAASGGRDSTALLHCCARAGRGFGIEVHGLHVHHGLQADADRWRDHVAAQCRRWGAGFGWQRLEGAPAPGDSVEAWARRGRYLALAAMARERGIGVVLLAHHRRDQAETFLIQALRGGGAAGLASMPRRVEREGILWVRPWLDQPRSAVEAYLRRHRLGCVEDTSNADPRYARGRLRGAVWPALLDAFPDAETTLARAAERAAGEAAVLAEVAEADRCALLEPGGALQVPGWLALASARRVLALRAWLAGALPAPVPETLVRRLAAELPQCRHAQWPAPGGRLLLRRGRLAFTHARPAGAAGSGP
ncbi:MAG: tRNA lysidine(34) synthetase TilS [Pseudomonadota bacterium]|nr:tRNA lysidine(34) synthetase TilS [Rubrivivax sp.]MCA3259556.1 tRNA lysidine(34) synthetase TilS [Rubrivivax sp.]MCE2912084.1 tRNA lysidine(34) synthetase TilS [Rubrivivax sp.]MCZ8030756.1 tRNA lysidine(34) synthetase TilS [Rubrivivax sp.]